MSAPEVAIDTQYEDLMREILDHGTTKGDRTGTGTKSIFGRTLRYNLAKSFPLITTKYVPLRLVITELLWFLRGEPNVKWLLDNNNHIWDEWADSDGELGPVYGVQWRSWPTPDGDDIDQLARVIDEIRRNPNSRRLVVSAWNVADLSKMALEPCHVMFQFYVADGKLSCMIIQRSCDMFLGVPFNIASYALLTHMVAQQTGLQLGDLIWVGGDCHIYDNHVDQVKTQLSRAPFPFPQVVLEPDVTSIDSYKVSDVSLQDYNHHRRITAPVAV